MSEWLTHWPLGNLNLILGRFKLTLVNGGWGISYEIALTRMPLDLSDDKSTLVQVMAWCCQATVLEICASLPVRTWQCLEDSGLGTFCSFFLDFMFMIWDSRHEELQLFLTDFQTLQSVHVGTVKTNMYMSILPHEWKICSTEISHEGGGEWEHSLTLMSLHGE